MKTQIIHLGSRKRVMSSEILYLKSDTNYTNIFLNTGENIFVSTHLGKIEARLSEQRFFRASRSYLVNLDFVKNYIDNETFGHMFLFNNEIIPLSRRRNKIFNELAIKF